MVGVKKQGDKDGYQKNTTRNSTALTNLLSLFDDTAKRKEGTGFFD